MEFPPQWETFLDKHIYNFAEICRLKWFKLTNISANRTRNCKWHCMFYDHLSAHSLLAKLGRVYFDKDVHTNITMIIHLIYA